MKVSKNMARVFSVLMIIFVLCSALMPVFAEVKIPSSADGDTSSVAAQKTEEIGKTILGVVQVIAGFAAVILLIVLAIKYMTSSPEGKADIKKTAIIYVVGAGVLFGASAILGAIQSTFDKPAGTV